MCKNLRVLLGSLAFAVSTHISARAADFVISSFDADTETWAATWGTTPDLTFNPEDAQGSATSGSLNINATYFTTANTWQQAVITTPFDPAIDMTQYTHMNMDVKVDASSTPNASGNYGYFEVKNPATGSAFAAGVNLTATEWTRISFPIPASLSSLGGLIIQLGAGNYLGPVSYNIDNITLTPRNAPADPPTLKLARAQAGLSLVAASAGQFDRQNIYTTDNTLYTFANFTVPVSYSLTIDSFPDNATYPNFQTHIFLVPGAPGTRTDPDYFEPTVIFMDIRSTADNGGQATFRLKTDQAGGNSEFYAPGLTTVNSATVLGTWTLTANANILTMTAPDGTVSAPIVLSEEDMALFDANLRVYFGVMANADANKGQGIHVAKIEIEHGADTLTETFNGDALNTELWTVNASEGGVQFIPASEPSWVLSWTLPDTGFKLQMTPTLTTPTWTDLDVTPVTVGLARQTVLPISALPASPTLFFRMVQ